MKRAITTLMLAVAVITVYAQSISSLWKSYEKAAEDDLPQTAISCLHKIQSKAEKQKKYGDLLMALMKEREYQVAISPDSLKAFDARMAERQERWKKSNGVVATMYLTATGRNNKSADIDSLLASPDAKTYTKANMAKTYKPFLEIEKDSKYFNHDLISVIALHTGQKKALQRHYAKTGNRPAACIVASMLSYSSMETIDSLINIYKDLPECGELAIKKCTLFEYNQNAKKLAWIDEALQRWPSWRNNDQLRSLREYMTLRKFSCRLNKQVSNSDIEQKLYFSNLRNINGVKVTLQRMQRNNYENFSVIEGEGTDARSFTHTFKAHNEYELWSDSMSLGLLPCGVWKITVSDIDNARTYDTSVLHITDMRIIEQTMPEKKRRYVVVNNITGHPVAGATLHLLDRKYKQSNYSYEDKTYITDANGECIVTTNDGTIAYAEKGNDNGMPCKNIYNGYSCGSASTQDYHTNIYTDRAIYRPGQTVHVAIICHSLTDGKESKAIEGKKTTLRLSNANYKEIAKATVTTDAYGTATADFTLPEDERNGRFSIATTGSNSQILYFRVEEYKRPTYEVTIEKPDVTYKVGDTLTVKGTAKTYSGVPVANAKVAYTVKRQTPWWWRHWYEYNSGDDATLIKDTIYTQADGTFTLRMPMVLPEDARKWKHCCFYAIEALADVTDIAGETHSASLSLPISNRSVFFGLDMPDKMLADKDMTIMFTRLNNIGRETEGKVSVMLDGTALPSAEANKDYALPADIPSGKHSLMAVCEGDTVKHDFVVFRKNDTKPMTYTHDWWYQSGSEFSEEDGTAWIQMATSDKDVYAVYSLFSGEKVLESGSLRMDNSVVTRTFTYKEEYGDGITYTVAWVKNDELYSHSGSIKRTLPSKKLQMQWTSFRDKLVPGQKEQWTLNIKNPDNTPAKAQLMAVLYDKSLDAIVGHSWSLLDYRRLFVPSAHWSTSDFSSIYMSANAPFGNYEFNELRFTDFSNAHDNIRIFVRGGSVKSLARNTRANMEAPMMMKSELAIGAYDVNAMEDGEILDEVAVVKAKAAMPVQEEAADDNTANDGLRTNFEETAFFMPQLITDGKGNVNLRFTLPESVTTWKFMGLAHDKDMRVGMLTDEAVAQKQLMVQPRMPRFLRQGDKANISATVANLSDKDINATVKMSLLNAKTEKELAVESMKVKVKKGETGTVTFPVDATSLPDDGIICRIIGEAANHKDGEQHLLPILPNTEEVVTTRTWTLFHPGDSTILLGDIMPGSKAIGKPHLAVTYTDSPAWMMVDVLSNVRTPDCGNAICLSSALYANVVASAIKDTLLYNGTANIIAQLKNLQHADGSFSWWPGMPGSRYMTMAVAKTLTRMEVLANGAKTEGSWRASVDNMLDKAMQYMATEMAEDVERMKKNKKDGLKPWLSDTQLDWLYTLAISDKDGGSTARYLIKLVEEDTKKADMATKAVAAVVMNKNGRRKDARTFIESIKEHTVYRSDIGRYFDSYRAAYSWCNYRIPTQTMCIEALKAVTPDDHSTIAEMQRWLLSSKRTQQWNNTYNTINAVHAFFDGDATMLKKGTPAAIAVDGKALTTTVLNERSALIKGETDVMSASPSLLVGKKTEGESWVSAYVTSRQKSSDIEQASTGITIKREVISGTNPKVGDKVKVKLTIEADRDYDFVTVTDNRAACLEPVNQLSGYRYSYYQEIKDKLTAYHYNMLSKGTHTIVTEYYIDREGTYNSGSATAVCAYADEFRGTTGAYMLQTSK